MPRGGRRPGAGQKKKPKTPPIESKAYAQELFEALNRPAKPDDPFHIHQWRRFTENIDSRIGMEARTRVEDRALGKAIHTVNHLHDKPIEMNVTHSLAEIISKARKRVSS